MNNKTIYIVTNAPIPIGYAPTNRILSYASGFVENGFNCKIIIFRKTENYDNIINKNTHGYVKGAEYKYLFNSTYKSDDFIMRRLDNIVGFFRLLFYGLFVMELHSKIIYYSSYTYPVLALKLSKIFKKHILIKEENEHPNIRLKSKNKLEKVIFNLLHFQLFDGFLLMTHNLMDIFNKTFPKKPKIHIPMTVDLNRFKKKINKKKVITYMGYLDNQKDGVDILIKAFSIVTKEFPEYFLNLYGETRNPGDLKFYNKLIKKLGIDSSKINFHGAISSESVPEKLSESYILVLPRPDSLQAQNGFPTKLGEYLATSSPVVVTSVGEIPLYLKDGKSAYIAEPGNPVSLSKKIILVLKDYKKAELVGNNGKKVAESNFNNIYQAQKIIQFFDSFN